MHPDSTYLADVLAFVEAAEERANEIKKALKDVDAMGLDAPARSIVEGAIEKAFRE